MVHFPTRTGAGRTAAATTYASAPASSAHPPMAMVAGPSTFGSPGCGSIAMLHPASTRNPSQKVPE